MRWCCSASVSVGAMSAAWAPFSTARSMARQRDNRLAASYLPHQQPLHRPLARQVGVDLVDRAHLVAGELERQRPAPAVHHHAARRERPRAPALAPRAPPPRHRELEQEQLLEREPPPRVALLLLGRPGSGRPPAPPDARRAPRRSAGARQRLGRASMSGRSLPDELAQALGRDPVRGGVDGHEPERVHRSARRCRAARALVTQNWLRWRSLPCRSRCAPSAELAGDPRLVEPDRHERAGVVEDARLDALLAPVAHRLDRDRADGDRDGRLLADARLATSCALASGRGASAGSARSGRPASRCPARRGP